MKLIKNNPPAGGQAFLIGILVFSFLGFLDAAYLSILHFKNAIPPCTISGCEIVLTSKFATILGVPISLIGAVFYFLLIILSVFLLTKPKDTGKLRILYIKQGIFLLTAVGFFISLILIYIQFAVIKSWCQYCVFSEIINTGLFGLAFYLRKSK